MNAKDELSPEKQRAQTRQSSIKKKILPVSHMVRKIEELE